MLDTKKRYDAKLFTRKRYTIFNSNNFYEIYIVYFRFNLKTIIDKKKFHFLAELSKIQNQ